MPTVRSLYPYCTETHANRPATDKTLAIVCRHRQMARSPADSGPWLQVGLTSPRSYYLGRQRVVFTVDIRSCEPTEAMATPR